MKLTPEEKLQGLRHSRAYRTDYLAYERSPESKDDCIIGSGIPTVPVIRLSEAGKRLCKKWDLQFPVKPSVKPGFRMKIPPDKDALPNKGHLVITGNLRLVGILYLFATMTIFQMRRHCNNFRK